MATRATSGEAVDGAPSLEQLLVRSGGGDTEAFAELYDRAAPHVHGLVTSLLEDQAVAEQVTCDAFVEVWRRAATYDAGSVSALAWTLAVTHRLAVRARRASRPASDVHRPTTVRDASAMPAAGLSPAQAEAVELAWFGGLDHREIDARIGADTPAAALLSEGLQLIATAGRRR